MMFSSSRRLLARTAVRGLSTTATTAAWNGTSSLSSLSRERRRSFRPMMAIAEEKSVPALSSSWGINTNSSVFARFPTNTTTGTMMNGGLDLLAEVAAGMEPLPLVATATTAPGTLPFLAELVSVSEVRVARVEVRASFFQALAKSLKKAYNNLHRLDRDDKDALYDYTSNGYGVLNNVQRGKEAMRDDIGKRIRAVCRALRKNKLRTFSGTVYRRLNSCDLSAELTATLMVEGATFSDPAFLSTSTNRQRYNAGGPEGVYFEIVSTTGKSVKAYSRHPEEDEVLFLPGTLFRIQRVWRGPLGELRVRMVEVA